MTKIFNNLGIKLFCLFLAGILWLYVSWPIERESASTFLLMDVPVEVKGITNNFDVIVEPEKISIEVQIAKRGQISLQSIGEIYAEVAIQNPQEGKTLAVISAKNILLPEFLKFVSAIPEKVSIKLIRRSNILF